MKVTKIIVVLALFAVVICGCNEQKLQSQKQDGTLSDGSSQVALLESKLAVAETRIAELEQENIDIQNLAMQCITKMITKQVERDQKIQSDLKIKIASLQSVNQTLVAKVSSFEAQNANIPQTAVSTLQ